MLTVVFDTVVFVRALINPYSVWGRLVFWPSGSYRLVLSPPILTEIVEVLARPELTRKFRRIAGLDHNRLIDILAESEVVEVGSIAAVSRDPKDDKFLATAKVAKALYVVSEDEYLLTLKEYQGIKIVPAVVFVRFLEQRVDRGDDQG
jgi:putative PIN family toxin of toxin-antitoxin system